MKIKNKKTSFSKVSKEEEGKKKEEKEKEGDDEEEQETKENVNSNLPNIPSSSHLESPKAKKENEFPEKTSSKGKELVFVPTDIILVPTDVIVESQMPSHILREIKEKLSHSQEIQKQKIEENEEKNEEKEYEKEFEKMTSEGGLGTQSHENQNLAKFQEKAPSSFHHRHPHPFEIRQERNPEEEAELPHVSFEKENCEKKEGHSYAEAAIHGVLEDEGNDEKKQTIPSIIEKDEKNSEILPLKDTSEFPPLTSTTVHKEKVSGAQNSPKPQQRVSS